MVLFCCKDVGPARYLAEIIREYPHNCHYLAGNFQGQKILEATTAQPCRYPLEQQRISLVVTGTSLGNREESPDKEILFWAKDHKIPSVSIIEHWGWYRKRFEHKNELVLPDFIIVNDNIAYGEAVAEGLPASIIKPLGNPYLEKLSSKSFAMHSAVELRNRYDIPLDKRVILFISEELKKSFAKNTSDYLGYDEFSVLDSLISQKRKTDYIIIKLHPEEPRDKYNELISESIGVMSECPVASLAVIADGVVGMASMLLLELAFFRKDVISCRPNATKSFIGENLSLTVPAKSDLELNFLLNNPTFAKRSMRGTFMGSKNRIVDFLLRLQK